ncbi:hypothetical protein JAAARDRAFT_73549 [Jaapia argillacea MUCL 33604]|uniref:F-box domain-containing protein n=1 Tax=Jaapia argillacea MUCL 33604 TaxID=933084 RepID=A0A067P9Y8_9AGAM|nr:hypothetical protein JAAARDRAFT_73549 [Jaapia argillacea MUCL 33604]
MPSCLLELPCDVVLAILKFIEFDDILSLLATCTALRSLSDSRVLWLDVLQQMKTDESQPLPCFEHQDLSLLELQSLQKIAMHKRRLERNWHTESPRVRGSIQAYSFDQHLEVLWVIPGSTLVLLHHFTQSMLVLWDFAESEALDMLPVGRTVYRFRISPKPGQQRMVLLASDSEYSGDGLATDFRVVDINYLPEGRRPFIHHRMHVPLYPSNAYPFVDGDEFGFVSDNYDETFDVKIFHLGTQTCYHFQVAVGPIIAGFHLRSFLYDGDFYLSIDDEEGFRVHHFPFPLYSASKVHQTTIVNDVPFILYSKTRVSESSTLDSGVPISRLTAISSDYDGDPLHPHTSLHFWPVSAISTPGTPSLQFYPGFETTLHGQICGSLTPDEGHLLLFRAASGRHALFLRWMGMDVVESDRYRLTLVHYHRDASALKLRDLPLPHFIPLAEVNSIALDDRRGVVILADSLGTLYTISYA